MPRRRHLYGWILLGCGLAGAIALGAGGWVYLQAVRTFEVRRVALPTRIFTDTYPLATGTMIEPEQLVARLERLGYSKGDDTTRPGTFVLEDGGLRVHLRAFIDRRRHRAPVRVRLAFEKGRIESVRDEVSLAPVMSAEVEPELLASIVGEALENRRPVSLGRVPQHLVDAVVVTEDVRFWQHPGVDPIGITRALINNLRAKGVSQGGSTLTQQLVKNYYLGHERTMRRKIVEAGMSLILDAKYTKQEILEAYLNDIYLGRNRSISVIGVGEAARFYFGKDVSALTIGESAILAGMIRSPNHNSPFRNPDRARQRRATVLESMLANGKITAAQRDAAVTEPIPVEANAEDAFGLSTIPYYVERVLDELASDYGIRDARGRGLTIYTAIDLDWQNEAARALEAGLRSLEKNNPKIRKADPPIEGAIVAVDVATAEVRAIVGGRNYQKSQFNRALKARRQVGSLFKPIAFLAAFEPSLSRTTMTPATLVDDSRFVMQRQFGGDWSPRNTDGQYRGVITIRRALELSLNAASVRVGMAAGLDSVIKAARALGIESKLEQMPSMILGAMTMTPIEMCEAYATIARTGSRVPIHAIRMVVDDAGNPLPGSAWTKPVQVFPARDVYLVQRLMEGVVRRGTGGSSRTFFRKTAAGKSGTTNDKRDAWFVGFTPEILALTWVGFDDNETIGYSSSDVAVPIWGRYMKAIAANREEVEFPMPAGIKLVWIDSRSGLRARRDCPPAHIVREAFKEGTEPETECPLDHTPVPNPLLQPEAPPMSQEAPEAEPELELQSTPVG